MRMLLLVLPLLLAGCVTDSTEIQLQHGRFASYHDMGVANEQVVLKDNPAPDDVKRRFAVCLADYTAKFITPDETKELDAYARGDSAITIGEFKRLLGNLMTRSGMTGTMHAADLDRLSGTCPDDVPAFKQYGLPQA